MAPVASSEATAAVAAAGVADAEDDPVLARALAMSVGGSATPSAAPASAAASAASAEPDLSAMTEDEQIAYAMRMSMQEDASTPTGGDSEDKKEDDDSEAMNDPAFLQSVLESLPGVDPQSDAVRQAVGAMSKSSSSKKDSEKKDDKDEKK